MSKTLIQIVDESDNLIGHKDRSRVNYQDDIYRITALWLMNSSGDVLIAQRKLTKDKDPGKWGPAAAGTMDQGETYEQNVYKEAEEEIGLKGIKLTIGPKVRINEPRNYFAQWYTAVVDWPVGKFTKQEEEVEQLAWINKDKLVEDVKANPTKYISTMPMILDLFS